MIEQPIAEIIRQVWQTRAPSADLRARTACTALDALRHARSRRARADARKLAATLYISVCALVLMVFIGSAGAGLPDSARMWLIVALAALGVAASALAVRSASRWGRVMSLPPALRWLPLAGLTSVLLVAAGLLNAPTHSDIDPALTTSDSRASVPVEWQASLDAVSRALTHTMTVSQSQAWLNAQLPASVERAWFVTPEGLVALSSITSANEISRSVMDFIAIAQTLPATHTGAAVVAQSASAILNSPVISTQAMVYSHTPYVLLVMVREAMRDLSATSDNAGADAQIIAQTMPGTGGTIKGIAALAVRASNAPAPSTAAGRALALLAVGVGIISLTWSAWVFLAERAMSRLQRRTRSHHASWAVLTALLLPVGLLMYLNAHTDD